MLTHSQNVFQAIGNAFKSAFLTAIKEIVSSQIAAMFTKLLTGQSVGLAAGGSTAGGSFGKIGGILGSLGLGSVPVFGGGGSNSLGALSGIVGGPGGTGGFAGPVGLSSGGAATGGASKLGIFGNLFGGGKNFLSSLGNIGFGPKGGDFGGEVAGSFKGVGGTTGGALLAGGGTARVRRPPARRVHWSRRDYCRRRAHRPKVRRAHRRSHRRGSRSGGRYRSPVHQRGGREVHRKGSQLYSLNIDKNLATQIVATAKQSFGGNLDVAIRSPQVRDLLQLYAMSTGQKFAGAPTSAQSLSLVQSGGQLFQAPTFTNGSAGDGLGGVIPSLGGTTPAGQQSAGVTIIQITVPGAKQFFQEETLNVVANSDGRAVQTASISGSKASSGRRESAALTLSPGLLTS
jgi:hypothetical protein